MKKKTIIVIILFVMVSVASFAEFVVSPKIGYEYKGGKVLGFAVDANMFDISADLMYKHSSGITVMFNNNLPLYEENLDIDDVVKFYNMHLIFGYTYRIFKGFSLTAGIGISAFPVLSSDFETPIMGMPLHIEGQYYFTRIIGVSAALTYAPTFYKNPTSFFGGGDVSTFHQVVLKFGPTFKF